MLLKKLQSLIYNPHSRWITVYESERERERKGAKEGIISSNKKTKWSEIESNLLCQSYSLLVDDLILYTLWNGFLPNSMGVWQSTFDLPWWEDMNKASLSDAGFDRKVGPIPLRYPALWQQSYAIKTLVLSAPSYAECPGPRTDDRVRNEGWVRDVGITREWEVMRLGYRVRDVKIQRSVRSLTFDVGTARQALCHANSTSY